MASEVNGNVKTFPTAQITAPFRAVTINSSGNAAYCAVGAGSTFDGVSMDQAVTSGDPVPVKLKKSAGTMRINMAITCSVGDTLYCAANGQGTTSSSGTAIGKALEACTAANGTIEFLPA